MFAIGGLIYMQCNKQLTSLRRYILLVLAGLVTSDHDVLVERDWTSEGDALITEDTAPGLE